MQNVNLALETARITFARCSFVLNSKMPPVPFSRTFKTKKSFAQRYCKCSFSVSLGTSPLAPIMDISLIKRQRSDLGFALGQNISFGIEVWSYFVLSVQIRRQSFDV
jgi:hypothetical protein